MVGTIDPASKSEADGITTWTFTAADVVDSNTVTVADANAPATGASPFIGVSSPINIIGAVAVLAPADGSNIFVNKAVNLVAQNGSGDYTWTLRWRNSHRRVHFHAHRSRSHHLTVTDNQTNATATTTVTAINALTIEEAEGKSITELGDDTDDDPLLALKPKGGDEGDVTWNSSNNRHRRSPGESGRCRKPPQKVVKPVAAGLVTITATDMDGNVATYKVRVVEPLVVTPGQRKPPGGVESYIDRIQGCICHRRQPVVGVLGQQHCLRSRPCAEQQRQNPVEGYQSYGYYH